jgi:hypothetical protein
MDGIQNTREFLELFILMHKAAIARETCALTVATLRGAIIYPKTTVLLRTYNRPDLGLATTTEYEETNKIFGLFGGGGGVRNLGNF